jgi:hypothetical protein
VLLDNRSLYARQERTEQGRHANSPRASSARGDPAPSPEDPDRLEYQGLQTYHESDHVSPLYAPDAVISIADLLPVPE